MKGTRQVYAKDALVSYIPHYPSSFTTQTNPRLAGSSSTPELEQLGGRVLTRLLRLWYTASILTVHAHPTRQMKHVAANHIFGVRSALLFLLWNKVEPQSPGFLRALLVYLDERSVQRF